MNREKFQVLLLYNLILLDNGWAFMKTGQTAPLLNSGVDLESAETIIENLTSGPLADSDLSVFFEETGTPVTELDSLIKSFRKPVTLFSVSTNTYDEDFVIRENSVVFLLNMSPELALLTSPPPILEARFIIALNLDPQINPESFFASSLFAKSRRSTLLHPFLYRRNRLSPGSMTFKIYQAEGFNAEGEKSQKINFWNRELFGTYESLFLDRWNSLGGATLHIANDYDDKPLIFQTSEGEVTGLSIKVLNELAETMNFSYTTQLAAADDEWGSFENGSWNGMLGEIYRREKNLTINYFTVTYARAQDFDFSSSYYTEGFGFVLKIPAPLPRWMNLIFPFTLPVWIIIGVTVITLTVVFYVYKFLFGHDEDQLLVFTSILLLKPLFKQPVTVKKTNNSGAYSALSIMWWLASLILAISYTCNFIAVLTVAKFPPRVLLAKQLADSDFRVAMLDYGEFVPEALKTSQDNILKKLGRKLDLITFIADATNFNYDECVELVLNGTHAHIETFSYLKLLYTSNFQVGDQVYFMTEQVYSGNLAFFFPKRTPWRHKFDEVIPRLVQSGITAKWYDQIMEKEMGNVREKQEVGIVALSLDHFQGAFYVFGIFLALSALAFLGELAFPQVDPDKKG